MLVYRAGLLCLRYTQKLNIKYVVASYLAMKLDSCEQPPSMQIQCIETSLFHGDVSVLDSPLPFD